jgi:hypothetical protein
MGWLRWIGLVRGRFVPLIRTYASRLMVMGRPRVSVSTHFKVVCLSLLTFILRGRGALHYHVSALCHQDVVDDDLVYSLSPNEVRVLLGLCSPM